MSSETPEKKPEKKPAASKAAAKATAPPAAPTPAVVISGRQLREALAFLAPDGDAEQLDGELVLEYMAPDSHPAGLYAYHVECPEEGSILLTGAEVEIVGEAITPTVSPDAALMAAIEADPALVALAQEAGELVGRVLAERMRQVIGEGYTAARDDSYVNGELLMAASCYVLRSTGRPVARSTFHWPFPMDAFKADGSERDLVKAMALILAEMQRRHRAGQA